MVKSFTINTPEYQKTQKLFFNYNVECKMSIEQLINDDETKVPSTLVKETSEWI